MSNFIRNIVTLNLNEVDMAIVKATYDDDHPPKEKHVVRLITLSHREHDAHFLTNLLRRLNDNKWRQVLKTLIVVHRLCRDGHVSCIEKLFQRRPYLKESKNFYDFNLTHISSTIRKYASYLDHKCVVYKIINFCPENLLPSKAKNWCMELSIEDILALLPAQQTQFDILLSIDPLHSFTSHGIISSIVSTMQTLLMRDALRLYTICMININIALSKYEELDKKQISTLIQCCYNSHYLMENYTIWCSKLSKANIVRDCEPPKINPIDESYIELLKQQLEVAEDPPTKDKEQIAACPFNNSNCVKNPDKAISNTLVVDDRQYPIQRKKIGAIAKNRITRKAEEYINSNQLKITDDISKLSQSQAKLIDSEPKKTDLLEYNVETNLSVENKDTIGGTNNTLNLLSLLDEPTPTIESEQTITKNTGDDLLGLINNIVNTKDTTKDIDIKKNTLSSSIDHFSEQARQSSISSNSYQQQNIPLLQYNMGGGTSMVNTMINPNSLYTQPISNISQIRPITNNSIIDIHQYNTKMKQQNSINEYDPFASLITQPIQGSMIPMQQLPMQQLPMQQLPMQQLPMQQLPMQQLPMQQLPMQQLPHMHQQQNHIKPIYNTTMPNSTDSLFNGPQNAYQQIVSQNRQR